MRVVCALAIALTVAAGPVRLAFPDLLGSSLKLSYDRFSIDATGVGAEFAIVPQSTRPLFLRYDPNTDFEPDNGVASVDHPDGSAVNADTIAANWTYDLGGWGVDLVAGHSLLDSAVDFDTDYSPAPAGIITSGDDNVQTTAELRFTSPELSGFFGLERIFGFGPAAGPGAEMDERPDDDRGASAIGGPGVPEVVPPLDERARFGGLVHRRVPGHAIRRLRGHLRQSQASAVLLSLPDELRLWEPGAGLVAAARRREPDRRGHPERVGSKWCGGTSGSSRISRVSCTGNFGGVSEYRQPGNINCERNTR